MSECPPSTVRHAPVTWREASAQKVVQRGREVGCAAPALEGDHHAGVCAPSTPFAGDAAQQRAEGQQGN